MICIVPIIYFFIKVRMVNYTKLKIVMIHKIFRTKLDTSKIVHLLGFK